MADHHHHPEPTTNDTMAQHRRPDGTGTGSTSTSTETSPAPHPATTHTDGKHISKKNTNSSYNDNKDEDGDGGLPGAGQAAAALDPGKETRTADGRRVLGEDDAEDALSFGMPEWRKWMILVIILLIQTSMNSNASMYGFAVDGLAEKYEVTPETARLGQMAFLVAYAFGCELWAPWSEEIGRWPTQQASLFLVNIWQISSALSPTFGGVIASRVLGGLSTSGGSVTLGVIADMYRPEDTGFQYAVAFVILSSVGGSPAGAVIGGFVGQYRSVEWIFWTLLIMGGIVQVVHFFLVPETNPFILLDREAKKRRKNGQEVYGPNEVKVKRFSLKETGKIWWRPYYMLLTEPIVIWLSLLSGFSDMLVFVFLEAFTPIFKQYGFETHQIGLAFMGTIVAYIIAYCTYLPVIWHHNKTRKIDPDRLSPESRLWWLLWLAPLLPIGLFGFAWTSFGPDKSHWIAPIIFAAVIGISNYGVYKSSIDYMLAAYGPFGASATGGNDFARDFLAGIAALYAHPFYESVGPKEYHLVYPSTILACMGVIFIIPIYIFYWKGPQIRLRSKFAQELEKSRQERLSRKKRRTSSVAAGAGEKATMKQAQHVEDV
ncbi:MFS general substrate transporter [Apiospora arundinis]|uniref:MFS general substrate transporter n=1 Tax=Apiospora arundinis TaxID=335852 RepID=A0ABR2I4E1_9PEZI